MILKMSCCNAKKIADIIVAYSIIDDMLCGYITEYNKLTRGEAFPEEAQKIKVDRASVGMGRKIECLCEIYPNHPSPEDGATIKGLKSKLCLMKDIRRQVAHDRRFSLKDSKIVPGLYKNPKKSSSSLHNIHKQFEKNFEAISPILKAYYSDWDYRQYYLYDIESEGDFNNA